MIFLRNLLDRHNEILAQHPHIRVASRWNVSTRYWVPISNEDALRMLAQTDGFCIDAAPDDELEFRIGFGIAELLYIYVQLEVGAEGRDWTLVEVEGCGTPFSCALEDNLMQYLANRLPVKELLELDKEFLYYQEDKLTAFTKYHRRLPKRRL